MERFLNPEFLTNRIYLSPSTFFRYWQVVIEPETEPSEKSHLVPRLGIGSSLP